MHQPGKQDSEKLYIATSKVDALEWQGMRYDDVQITWTAHGRDAPLANCTEAISDFEALGTMEAQLAVIVLYELFSEEEAAGLREYLEQAEIPLFRHGQLVLTEVDLPMGPSSRARRHVANLCRGLSWHALWGDGLETPDPPECLRHVHVRGHFAIWKCEPYCPGLDAEGRLAIDWFSYILAQKLGLACSDVVRGVSATCEQGLRVVVEEMADPS